MEVVKITQEKKRQDCRVLLEDGSSFRMDLEGVLQAGLRPGREVSPDDLAQLEARREEHRVRERALRLIAYRAHSRRELMEKLHRETDAQTAELVVDQLEASGLIDDSAYACELAASLSRGKGYGRRRVEQELRRRGIRGEVLEQALAQLPEESVEEIEQLLACRYPQGLTDERELRRAAGRLIRRGYSCSLVQAALEPYREQLSFSQSPDRRTGGSQW